MQEGGLPPDDDEEEDPAENDPGKRRQPRSPMPNAGRQRKLEERSHRRLGSLWITVAKQRSSSKKKPPMGQPISQEDGARSRSNGDDPHDEPRAVSYYSYLTLCSCNLGL